jgi:arylsulfatase A-like enzyme
MRKDNWKIIVNGKEAEPLLFDLKQDIGETTNLAKQYPEKITYMTEKMNLWEKDVNSEK